MQKKKGVRLKLQRESLRHIGIEPLQQAAGDGYYTVPCPPTAVACHSGPDCTVVTCPTL